MASSVPKSEGAIVRMHLVSYDFRPIKVLPEGDIGVNVSNHPKQYYLRKGRRVRKKEERGGKSFPREEKKGQEDRGGKPLQWLKFRSDIHLPIFFVANPRCDYTCICGPSNWLLAEASDSLSSANWH